MLGNKIKKYPISCTDLHLVPLGHWPGASFAECRCRALPGEAPKAPGHRQGLFLLAQKAQPEERWALTWWNISKVPLEHGLWGAAVPEGIPPAPLGVVQHCPCHVPSAHGGAQTCGDAQFSVPLLLHSSCVCCWGFLFGFLPFLFFFLRKEKIIWRVIQYL